MGYNNPAFVGDENAHNRTQIELNEKIGIPKQHHDLSSTYPPQQQQQQQQSGQFTVNFKRKMFF